MCRAPLSGGEHLRVAEQRIDVQFRRVQRRLQRTRLLLEQRQHIASARRRPPEQLRCRLCLALHTWAEIVFVCCPKDAMGVPSSVKVYRRQSSRSIVGCAILAARFRFCSMQ